MSVLEKKTNGFWITMWKRKFLARKWCCRFVTIQYWARKSWTFDSWKFNSEWLSVELSPAHYWILTKMYFSICGKKLSKNSFFSLIFRHLCILVFASYKKCFRLSHALSYPKTTQNFAQIRAKFRVKVLIFLSDNLFRHELHLKNAQKVSLPQHTLYFVFPTL